MLDPLPESHKVFINSDTVCAESEDTIAERWMDILTDAPELNIQFYDFDRIREAYAKGYATASGQRLIAYVNHAYLLAHYLNFLQVNNMILCHAHANESVQQQLWVTRFAVRTTETRSWRRTGKDGKRLRKPQLPPTDKIERNLYH